MTLHEQIYELYLLEKQVLGLQGRLNSATRRFDLRKAKLDQFLQQQSELQEQVKQAKVAVNTYEGQTKELDEKIAKGREEMNQVTNNKAYSALLVEINTWKDDKSRLDDEALAVIEKLEQKETALSEVSSQVDEQQKLVDLAAKEVEEAKSENGDQLERCTAERDAAGANVSDDARRIFEHASRINDGDALAGIVEENRRHMEYSCGGCYMSIPPEKVSAVMGKPDILTTCPNCSRILFMEAELKEELTK